MRATFIEFETFRRRRSDYLDDDDYRRLQASLMTDPECGRLVPDAGGLRKMRFADGRRGKGTRGGLRVMYFWWEAGAQFWMFTLFDKGEVADLTAAQRRELGRQLKARLITRTHA